MSTLAVTGSQHTVQSEFENTFTLIAIRKGSERNYDLLAFSGLMYFLRLCDISKAEMIIFQKRM